MSHVGDTMKVDCQERGPLSLGDPVGAPAWSTLLDYEARNTRSGRSLYPGVD
ncbi:hypothetical protein E2C01_059955 [Portunus trituberculatus]|uniref:Uncharacterized protein n=1 Tax=Portunus trituberculatus TaxID=210409 RepID=A0A5B7H7L2_PORTR|nr:hypothetical protein [Portunus trituberculatus]